MLAKLIKHEFHATGRIMLPLFAIVLFISALAHFAVNYMNSDLFVRNTPLRVISGITIALFVIGIMAVAIVSVVLMIQRFRTNILGDEGYLTMTLPSSVHGLLWAKIIVSVVWFALTAVVTVLALFILLFRIEFIKEMIESIKAVLQMINGGVALNMTVVGIESLILAVVAGIVSCLTFYAALSFGHGFAKHKMLYSVVFFFAASTILSWLTTSLLFHVDFEAFYFYTEGDAVHSSPDFMRIWHTYFGTAAVIELIHGAIYYVVTVLNLKHRLNLE